MMALRSKFLKSSSSDSAFSLKEEIPSPHGVTSLPFPARDTGLHLPDCIHHKALQKCKYTQYSLDQKLLLFHSGAQLRNAHKNKGFPVKIVSNIVVQNRWQRLTVECLLSTGSPQWPRRTPPSTPSWHWWGRSPPPCPLCYQLEVILEFKST